MAASRKPERGGEFTVRALTRNPDSDKARALAAAGAELVRADLDDQASLERAFAGAHGVFALTNFWEHFSPEKEDAQARNLAYAAKAAGVGHVVWSTLEDTRQRVPLTLVFEDAQGRREMVEVSAPVRPLATTPAHRH